jgi:hypothetical protein
MNFIRKSFGKKQTAPESNKEDDVAPTALRTSTSNLQTVRSGSVEDITTATASINIHQRDPHTTQNKLDDLESLYSLSDKSWIEDSFIQNVTSLAGPEAASLRPREVPIAERARTKSTQVQEQQSHNGANQGTQIEVPSSRGVEQRAGNALKNYQDTSKLAPEFTVLEGSLDAEDLLQSFRDLNMAIRDFAHAFMLGLPVSVQERALESRHYRDLHNSLRDRNARIVIKEMSKYNNSTMDIVDPLMRYVVCAELWKTVFRPFAPGLPNEVSKALRKTYKVMRTKESQKDCGKWRSMFSKYTPVPEEGTFIQEVVDKFIAKSSKILTVLTDGRQVDLPETDQRALFDIFQRAVKAQKTAKRDFLDFDYEVFFPLAKQPFSLEWAEYTQGGKQPPTMVWFTVGLGVSTTRNVLVGDKLFAENARYPVKAAVICDNWDPMSG